MEQEPENSPNAEKRRSLTDLLIWLALVPFILGTLICCGQLALVLIPGNPSANTLSLLKADYLSWPYDTISPIDVEAFLRDVEREERLFGETGPEEVVIVDDYWVPPTPTAIEVAAGTGTPTPPGPTPTPTSLSPTPTHTLARTSTIVPTITRQPTSTALPTITVTASPTRTYPPPPPPTLTNTSEPPPPPVKTSTVTRTPTNTPETPSPTVPTPTLATETPTPTPTYAPVRPIAENNGVAEAVGNGGCRAYFGYRNDNAQEVDILTTDGTRNWIDDPVAQANPPQPEHFMVGRVFRAFEFTWYTGQNLTWWLDDRPAVAYWCITPTP